MTDSFKKFGPVVAWVSVSLCCLAAVLGFGVDRGRISSTLVALEKKNVEQDKGLGDLKHTIDSTLRSELQAIRMELVEIQTILKGER